MNRFFQRSGEGHPESERIEAADVRDRLADDLVELAARGETEAVVLWLPHVPDVDQILAHLLGC